MSVLPEIVLDDRRFQDLVNEARLRIAQSCPEWTEHNVSDPGITLIELFAWMTEMLIYRVNRIPDKLHVALLELLGIGLEPPTAATVDIQFRLAAPPTEPVVIPGGETEVGTLRTASEEAIVFQTNEDFEIPPAQPTAYAIEKARSVKQVGVASGTAKPKGEDQRPFGTPPQVGESLYLGFEEPLARMVLQLDVDCSQARGAGVDPEDPPLRWEVSSGQAPDGWESSEVLVDRTGGFNYGSGVIELQLPPHHSIATVGGQRAYWLRCRVDAATRSGAKATGYQNPPEIYSITGRPIGASIPASHAARETEEILGESDGTPGQTFRLRHAPILAPLEGETLEVRAPEQSNWERWELVDSFVDSGPGDHHYLLDLPHGELQLGPAVRAAEGGWRQYGAVPSAGAMLRFPRYRYGGGRHGNVAAGSLTMLKSAIPGVVSVTNRAPALGGVDVETLDSARRRASMELHTRNRAVTGEDFEFLAGEASQRVARAYCAAPVDGGPIRLHILPRVEPPDRPLDPRELMPDEALFEEVAAYLEPRRLIGTTLELLPARLRGVSVVVNVVAAPNSDLERVEEDVAYALYTYLNPLVGGSRDGLGEGWQFGRTLNQGELYGVVHAVDGVEFVKILRVYEADIETGKQAPKQAGTQIALEPDELIASTSHIVKAERREQ
jgi:predicted phage baseplate assembly protein